MPSSPPSLPTHAAAHARPTLDIAQLFRAHAARVERTLLRLGVRASDVPDATQEVFLVVHRKLQEFEGRASISTWLYRIALRVAAGQRRLARHRREVTHEPLLERSSADLDPQAELERRAQLRDLAGALDRLSEPQRAVIALHELEGLRMHEVARILRIPRKTAFSRMYAARRALATELRRLGYALPAWFPFWPGSSCLSARWRGTPGAGSAGPGTSAAVKLPAASSGLWSALCVGALLSLPAAPNVAVPSAAGSDVDEPVAQRAVTPAASKLTAAREAPMPPHSGPRALLRRRKQSSSEAKPSPALASPPQAAEVAHPAETAAAFAVTRVGSSEVRPVIEHPFASRLRASEVGAASWTQLAVRLAPDHGEARVPVDFDSSLRWP